MWWLVGVETDRACPGARTREHRDLTGPFALRSRHGGESRPLALLGVEDALARALHVDRVWEVSFRMVGATDSNQQMTPDAP